MIIYHIFLKFVDSQRETLETEKSEHDPWGFDLKIVLLACLRIAAVSFDLDISQEQYTKVYYDSVKKDQDQLSRLHNQIYQKISTNGENQSPIQSQTLASGNTASTLRQSMQSAMSTEKLYVTYDKIIEQLRSL
mmetsp:Transcript_5083/g.8663  ORF Transcript_5083/g.8663 Transcript_5083/m.8663 type:complete len:134 (-) Transcript_5083:702-1103(-)